MRPIATDVACSAVCLSVSHWWAHGWAVQKHLTDRDAYNGGGGWLDSCGPKEPCTKWRSRSQREEAILRFVWPTEKYLESLLLHSAKGITQSSITAWYRDCCSRLHFSWLIGVTLYCSREKSAPAMRSFVKISRRLVSYPKHYLNK